MEEQWIPNTASSLHSKPYYQNTRASSAPAHLLVLLRTNQSSAIALFLSALFSQFLHLSHRARLATVLLNVYKEITSALSGTLIRVAWKYIGESCHPAVNHRKATTMLYDHFYFVLKHLYWTGRNPQQADLEKFNTVPSVGWGEINMRKAPTESLFLMDVGAGVAFLNVVCWQSITILYFLAFNTARALCGFPVDFLFW